MFQFRNFQLEPPLNVHCGMPAWKMNHLGQTGLAGTHLVQTVNRVGPRSGHGQTGLAGTHPVHFLDRVGPRQTGLVGAHPVWFRPVRSGPDDSSSRLNAVRKRKSASVVKYKQSRVLTRFGLVAFADQYLLKHLTLQDKTATSQDRLTLKQVLKKDCWLFP